MKINKREKMLAYAIGALVLFFLVEHFFFSGLRGRSKNIVQQIKLEENRLKSGLDIQKRKDRITAECKELKPYLEKAEGLSDQEIFAKFLKEAEKDAQEAGVSIMNLAPQSEIQDTAEYKQYNAEFRAEGSLAQIFSFIGKVQNDTLLLKIIKMSISAKDEQASVMKIEAVISLVVPK